MRQTLPELDVAMGEQPPEMPSASDLTAALDDYAGTEGKAIVEWLGIPSFAGTRMLDPSAQLGGGLLGGYLRRLREAADTGERFGPPGLTDLVRRFYETLEVPRGIRTVYDTSSGEERWVPTYRDLAERAAIELDDLLSSAPRLSRCRLCGRVFVVRGKRAEAHCRQYLWLAWPPRSFLERCLPPSPDERERTRKRLHQRYRRALAKHGDGRHADVRDALDRCSRFVRSEPSSPRGRRPVPRPGFVEKSDK